MRIGKKLAMITLLTGMAIGLTACGKEAAKEKESEGKTNVVATVFAEYDFLRNIAGDNIDLTMMMKPGGDLHSYEPSPKDMMAAQEADLFVTIGGEADAWSEKITDSIDSKKVKVVKLMDCVDVVEEELVEGMQEEEESEEEGGEEEKELDEHVWTAPKNAIKIVNKLSETLCSLDKEHAGLFKKNTKKYVKRLEELDKKFADVIDHAKRKEIIVGDRFPFRYFADAYDLKYYAAFPGCSVNTGASAETISFLVNKVKEDKIPVVFHMEMSNESICDVISSETGAKKEQLNAVHNISKEDFTSGKGYLELMEENVSVLKEALN